MIVSILNRARHMMDCIQNRQAAVTSLLNGDDTHLENLLEHYSYIAEESARYVFYTRGVKSVPLEDVQQQGHLWLSTLLHRNRGSQRMSLAAINTHDRYDDCLGLRPYLITYVRRELEKFITESGMIRIPHSTFDKGNVEKYGQKEVPKLQSITGMANGETFDRPIEDIRGDTPQETAILKECLERLKLSYLERQILHMRQQEHTLEEIGQVLGKDKATISRKLKTIGERWLSANS